jgi:hypothetical protein
MAFWYFLRLLHQQGSLDCGGGFPNSKRPGSLSKLNKLTPHLANLDTSPFRRCWVIYWNIHRAVMDDKGFLVGEPFDHRRCKITGRFLPTYAAFIQHNNKFFEGPNMTAPEYQAFKVQDLTASEKQPRLASGVFCFLFEIVLKRSLGPGINFAN